MIFRPELAKLPDMVELRNAIARIAMLSQVSAANTAFGTPSTDDDIGGRRPSGGINYKDDRQQDFALRSVDYFTRRLTRCHTERAVTELLREANETLAAWKKSARLRGVPPLRGSFEWKCEVADDERSLKEAAVHYGVARSTVSLYRARYRGVMNAITERIDEAV